ncbi:uncharacterized protein LOC111715638 [Eurytemora carolleeae]|uniref:uncharacterized protein LOC111715638 n=1 Tax=Eurytemora carolleeae TaxID=1294199 RepID=UPI000C75783B|nr:uncharacterized protein LOC111715638 [Eurytemora carolleeae]|eukprot:XP_023346755.1 uncharacterized protein LOC111715638 [Eurytemora affinis]
MFRLNESYLMKILILLAVNLPGVPAPVTRCSPFIIINKVVEWQSWSSDMNPYFPVPPCEYGGPLQAILAGDMNAVFLLDEPELIPRHNTYEFLWFLKTGYTRLQRMLAKKEPFEYDFNILREGYDHHSETSRRTQFGHGPVRRPEVLDDEVIFTNVAGEALKDFWKGQDKVGSNFNAEGLLLYPEDTPLGSSTDVLQDNPEHQTIL